jgi:hypothetical protein
VPSPAKVAAEFAFLTATLSVELPVDVAVITAATRHQPLPASWVEMLENPELSPGAPVEVLKYSQFEVNVVLSEMLAQSYPDAFTKRDTA